MPETAHTFAPRGVDGLAQIGPSFFQLRGIRLAEGEQGAAPAAPAPSVDPGEAALAAAITAADAPTPQTVDALPDWAQKIVRDARTEAAQYRTSAKSAADDAQKNVMDTLRAALGFQPDLNPEVLAQSLKDAQAQADQNARTLAIYKAAGAAGANVDRLMDSRSAMEALSQVDPTDPAALTAAITAATTANPYLRAAQAAASSGAPLTGSHEDGQITDAQLATMTPEQIAAAYDGGKLGRLLGA